MEIGIDSFAAFVTDAQGNPIFNANQGLGQTGQQFAGGFSGLGQKYIDQAGAAPESSSAALDRAYDAATAFSAPRQARQSEAMNTRLVNQGLDPSSEAYRNRMRDVAENQSSANNTLAAGLQGQIFQQGLQGRQQQMSELQPGVQFGASTVNPSLVNAPGVNVNNVDIAGLNQSNQAGQWQNYNAQLAQRNAMLGGLAGIGGSILAAPMTGGGSVGGMLTRRMFG
jgi:hypothetical protein